MLQHPPTPAHSPVAMAFAGDSDDDDDDRLSAASPRWIEMTLAHDHDGEPGDETLSLTFLAEGAANIVYKIAPASARSTSSSSSSSAAASTASPPAGGHHRRPFLRPGDGAAHHGLDDDAGAVAVTVRPPNVAVHRRLLRVSKVFTTQPPTPVVSPQSPDFAPDVDDDEPVLGIPNINAVAGLPAATPEEVQGQLHFYDTVVRPALPPSQIIDIQPVTIGPQAILELNKELQRLEAKGRARRGSRIPVAQPEAFFVTDMTSDRAESFSLEIKPKWLAQSPDAPAAARRCRTCALKAYRRQAGVGQGFCPLRLISGDPRVVRPIVQQIIKGNPFVADSAAFYARPSDEQDRLVGQLTDFFSTGGDGLELLHRLRALQTRLDPAGILALAHEDPEPPSDEMRNLCNAMTFRDCSLFLKVYWDGRPINVRVGDLDLKTSAKLDSWAGTERNLVDGGWYFGNDSPPDVDCCLAN